MASLQWEVPILYKKQLEFCKSKYTYTLFGGMRGGGKSFTLRVKCIDLCFKYAGIHILIMRRTNPELEENHAKPLRAMLKCGSDKELAKYKVSTNEFIFPNGSIIKLGHCQHEADVDKYQGHQYQVIALDEATHFTEHIYMKLTECLRLDSVAMSNDPVYKEKWKNFKCRMYLTANPGGVGHIWVKRLFIDKIYKNKENPDDYCYIPCSVFENEFIMENDRAYIDRLEALPEKERQAMLFGDWNVFEGQYFEEFDDAVHIYDPNEVTIKPEWRRYRTRDYGLDKTACYWIAMDENGTCYVYRELWQSNLVVKQSGDVINSMTLPIDTPFLDICPPDLWNRSSQTGRSVVDVLRDECGQYPTKANNDFYVGCLMIKEFLRVNQETGLPRLIISKDCPHLIESIRMIQHDEKNVNVYAKEPHEPTHSCLVGDTLVETTKGSIKIKDLLGHSGECYSYNTITEKVEIKPFDTVVCTNPNADIYEITLDNGKTIKCTYDHPILTRNRGYVKAIDLTENDDVVEVDLCKSLTE